MCLLGVLGGNRSEAVIPVYDTLEGSRDIEFVKQRGKQRKHHCRVRTPEQYVAAIWLLSACISGLSDIARGLGANTLCLRRVSLTGPLAPDDTFQIVTLVSVGG